MNSGWGDKGHGATDPASKLWCVAEGDSQRNRAHRRQYRYEGLLSAASHDRNYVIHKRTVRGGTAHPTRIVSCARRGRDRSRAFGV